MPTFKQDKTRIIQIWGDILDAGFTSVPNILLRYRANLGIKPKHLSLIIDIMSFKWDKDSPFPSYSTLAHRAGIEERSIKRITQDLEELNLLIKDPRFDEETGAQITTIFDFRPLIKKLTGEMAKVESSIEHQEIYKGIHKEPRYDKNVMGGGDKNVTGGVTKKSWGGVTKMSPKEYTYINNITYGIGKKQNIRTSNQSRDARPSKKGLTDIKNSIFKTRLYELYDNMLGVKNINNIVEEGAYKALKEIFINRAYEISDIEDLMDIDLLVKNIKTNFPYSQIPKEPKKARSFYVRVLSNLVAQNIDLHISDIRGIST